MTFDVECLQSLSRDAERNPTVHALLSSCGGWAPQSGFLAKRDLCTVHLGGVIRSNTRLLVCCLQTEKWILKYLQYFQKSQVRNIPVLRALLRKTTLVKLSLVCRCSEQKGSKFLPRQRQHYNGSARSNTDYNPLKHHWENDYGLHQT